MKVNFEILPYRHLFVFGDSAKDWVKEIFNLELSLKAVAFVKGFTVAHNSIRLRIQRCIPKVGKELREGFSPLKTNVFDYATIARVYYRGRTPRTLALFEGNVKEGVKIKDEGKDVGLITSVAGLLALGYILRDKAQEGKRLVRLC